MDKKERNLSGLLVDRIFQFKLLSYFFGLFLLTTISLYSTTYLFFWNMKNKGLKVGIPEGHVYYQFLLNQKHDLDLLFIGLVAFNLVLLITVGLVISHRVAGPIFKIVQHLTDPKLNQEPIKFRENDFFKELAPLINKLRGLE